MKKLETKDVKPCGVNLSVKIKITEKEINGVKVGKQLASKSNVEFYMGEVLALGKNVSNQEQCPELEVGDFVMFNQFSGAVVASKDDYLKVITGYDVVAISKTEDMNIDTINPANDRILIKILNESSEVNGVEVEEVLDARDKQTQMGVVLKLGKNTESDIAVGDTVFIDPFCGNLIINDSDLKLKTLNYRDILYKI
jgi:co-chaperonin GroES (HSP10)